MVLRPLLGGLQVFPLVVGVELPVLVDPVLVPRLAPVLPAAQLGKAHVGLLSHEVAADRQPGDNRGRHDPRGPNRFTHEGDAYRNLRDLLLAAGILPGAAQAAHDPLAPAASPLLHGVPGPVDHHPDALIRLDRSLRHRLRHQYELEPQRDWPGACPGIGSSCPAMQFEPGTSLAGARVGSRFDLA